MEMTLDFNTALQVIDRNIRILATRHNIDFDTLMEAAVKGDNYILVPVETGSLSACGILKSNDASVARLYAQAGTRLINHTHDEHEMLKVVHGCLYLYLEDKKVLILRDNDAAYVPQNAKHSSFWPEDTEYIAVTIPGSKVYPEGNTSNDSNA